MTFINPTRVKIEHPTEQLDQLYVRKDAAAALWLAPPEMRAANGAPTLAGLDLFPVWLLDPATEEAVAFSYEAPVDWKSFRVEVWWVNAGAGAGQVVWRLDRRGGVVGQPIGGAAFGAAVGVAAPGQNVLARTVLATDLPAPTLEGARVVREAANGGDTLANDAAVVGVRLVRQT